VLPVLAPHTSLVPAFSNACAAKNDRAPPPANTPGRPAGLAAAVRLRGRIRGVVDARFRTIFTEPGGRIGFM